MTAKNKTQAILNYLKTHKGLTSKQAYEKFDTTRLSAIIFNLRNQGYNIETETKYAIDKYGSRISYARYVLHS